jgi:hypothetical protein
MARNQRFQKLDKVLVLAEMKLGIIIQTLSVTDGARHSTEP